MNVFITDSLVVMFVLLRSSVFPASVVPKHFGTNSYFLCRQGVFFLLGRLSCKNQYRQKTFYAIFLASKSHQKDKSRGKGLLSKVRSPLIRGALLPERRAEGGRRPRRVSARAVGGILYINLTCTTNSSIFSIDSCYLSRLLNMFEKQIVIDGKLHARPTCIRDC